MNPKTLAKSRKESAHSAPAVEEAVYIPSGCTVLNLYLSGKANGGYRAGKIGHIVGDSDTGKSLILLTTLAAAAHDSSFDNYQLILDDVELSNEFDIPEMFGLLDDRLTGPDGDGSASKYTEDFYASAIRLIKAKKPFIYGLDSMDALKTLADEEKLHENLELHTAGKDDKVKGSYGMGKAKQNSDNLGNIKSGLQDSQSLLLIVSQTRDNIGIGFATKTHAGGRALKFYSCWQMWLAVEKTLKRTVEGKERTIGTMVRVKVAKNHCTGKHGEFSMPMYYGHGIDDIRCTIEWLVAEKWWSLEGGTLITRGEVQGKEAWKLNQFLTVVTDEQLQGIAQTAWDTIDAGLRRRGRWAMKPEETEEPAEEPEMFEE